MTAVRQSANGAFDTPAIVQLGDQVLGPAIHPSGEADSLRLRARSALPYYLAVVPIDRPTTGRRQAAGSVDPLNGARI